VQQAVNFGGHHDCQPVLILCGPCHALAGNNEMLTCLRFYLVFVCTGAQATAEDDQQVDTRGIKGHDLDVRPAGRMGFHPPG